jgi:hypothetical protein
MGHDTVVGASRLRRVTSVGAVLLLALLTVLLAGSPASAAPVNPTITGITPSSGPVGGGTTITITGTNLNGVTALTVGGNPCPFSNNTATSVTCVTPGASGPGAASVVVMTGNGPVTLTDGFTYFDVPGAVQGIQGDSGDRSATLTFAAPANDGGSPVIRYEYRQDGGPWTTLTTTPAVPAAGPYSATFTGLTNGTPYLFQVRAVNAAGAGESRDAPVYVVTGPTAPQNLVATAQDGEVQFAFDAPADDGGNPVIGYEYSTDGGTTWSSLTGVHTPHVTASVTGLTNGTQYTFLVRAFNEVKPGTRYATAVATPATLPSAPRELTAVAANQSAVVTFGAPASNGGSAITGYEYSIDGLAWNALTYTGSGPYTGTVPGLTNGTAYTLHVRAVNSVGSGPGASAEPVTPAATPPSAPLDLVVARIDGGALLEFTVPASDGGSPITGYEYTLDGGSTWQSLAASGDVRLIATIAGLDLTGDYTIQVRAVNAIGAGARTAATPVPPAGPPSVPQMFASQPASVPGTVVVSFDAPASDGGSPVTGYQYSIDGGQTWAALTPVGPGPYHGTIAGLQPGAAYQVMIRAVNAIGPGPSTAALQVRAAGGVPTSPTSTTPTSTGPTSTGSSSTVAPTTDTTGTTVTATTTTTSTLASTGASVGGTFSAGLAALLLGAGLLLLPVLRRGRAARKH